MVSGREIFGCEAEGMRLEAKSDLSGFSARHNTVRLGGIDHPQIERRLFSATTGAIFIAIVAWSPPVSEPLHATFRSKIAPVVAENKRRPIFTSVVDWKF